MCVLMTSRQLNQGGAEMGNLQQALDNSPAEQSRKALQKNRRINLRVSQAEHAAIAQSAEDEGMTISEYILALHFSHASNKAKPNEVAVLNR
jgi:predicted DNA binding CopG/RHH family protein